jgi:hypothetical protein
MSRRIISLALVTVMVALPVLGRDRPIVNERPDHTKMRAYNIGITAFFAVFSAMRHQGRIDWGDVWKHLLVGGAAGASFYEAKRMTGDGRRTAGWILTNVTSSVVENYAAGEHPFGRIGYTVGPMRFRVAVPGLARKGVAHIEADWSLYETGALAYALNEGDSISFRNGLIAVDKDTPWDLDGRRPTGATFGIYPGVIPHAYRTTWSHEMVHAIQQQQFDSVEAPQWTFGGATRDRDEWTFLRFRHINVGYVHAIEAFHLERDYADRWNEVEAYWLAEETPVQP